MQQREAASTLQWQSLAAVADAIRSCTRCELSGTRTNAVPGEGAEFPSIMFIGEGPGFNEDQQGRPFVGRAGELLEELLARVPLRREDVFITNVVKCRPPENRDPLPAEVQACWPYLEAQIALLQPRVIATLGRHSLMRFFPNAKISSQHGRPLRWRDNIVVFPLYHPAAGLRSTQLRVALEQDMKKLPAAVIAALDYERGAGSGTERSPAPAPDGVAEAAAVYGAERPGEGEQQSLF